ncbi:MAG: carbohydrate-binding family 9-like protein [Candidatus Omnitrophica bacterium]|nr:carbohydrate-binding family 9-like protein [Candidatus Omnitrophota bacterium]
MEGKSYVLNIWLFLIFFPVWAFCQGIQDEKTMPEILCRSTTGEIKIDGNLDESDWKNAESVEFVKIISLEKPVSRTIAYCLYDRKYLYVAFKCYDRDIWATYQKRDQPLYQEDVVEIFFKPDFSKDSYYEFEFSPKNIILDAFVGKRALAGNMFFRFAQWNCIGLKSSVKIKGTLNDWSDIDDYWTIEIAIPFQSLPSIKKIPEKGDIWLFNLARYDYSIYVEDGMELVTAGRITKFDLHRYQEWCFLKFQ